MAAAPSAPPEPEVDDNMMGVPPAPKLQRGFTTLAPEEDSPEMTNLGKALLQDALMGARAPSCCTSWLALPCVPRLPHALTLACSTPLRRCDAPRIAQAIPS